MAGRPLRSHLDRVGGDAKRAYAAKSHLVLRRKLNSSTPRLRQERLAERADLDTTYISGIERGQRNPGLNTMQRLAGALGVTLPVLVSDLRQPRHGEVRRGRPRKRSLGRK